jgi:hypothetical protein
MDTEEVKGILCYVLHHRTNGQMLVTSDYEFANSLSKDGEGDYAIYIARYYNPQK